MADGERLHLRVFGPFEAEVRDADGNRRQLDATPFRPLIRLLIGMVVEDGGSGMSIDLGRVVRVLWEETVDGPGEVYHRRADGRNSQGHVESIKTGDEIARERVNRTLNDLRKALGDRATEPRFIRRDGDMLTLVNTTADVTEFSKLWKAGSYDDALTLAERGAFLSGTRMRQRNESAQQWLEEARLSWANRLDSCLASRERAHSRSNDRQGAFNWARARKSMALAYGDSDLIGRAARDLQEYERDHRAPAAGPGVARGDGSDVFMAIEAQLEAWHLLGGSDRGTVAVVLGSPSAQAGLPEVATSLSAHGIDARFQSGGSGRFGHALALKATLSEATHCLYLLGEGEQATTGWAAFVTAIAAEAGVLSCAIDTATPTRVAS